MAKLKLPFELEKPSPDTFVTQASEVGYEGKPMTEVVPETKNTQSGDLVITDDNGNIIAKFSNGHFQVKNFNSQNAATKDAATTSSNGLMSSSDKTKLNGIQPNAEVNDAKTSNLTSADFEITDESGNAIVRFKNGHIQVKNFNSANIVPPTNDSVLKNKKIAIIGDSITEGYYASPVATKKYTAVIQSLTGCIMTNLGVASTCLANNTLNNMSGARFVTRATANNLSDKDVIFVFGGTNDFSYDCKAIGNLFEEEVISEGAYIGTKKKTAIQDTDTFAGALHELILQIRSVAPTARLIFITPLNRGRYSEGRPTSAECNKWGDYIQDFCNAIKEICIFYGVPVIDMNSLFNEDWSNDTSSNKSSMDSDGIHPNNLGHERIAKIIVKWCESNLII